MFCCKVSTRSRLSGISKRLCTVLAVVPNPLTVMDCADFHLSRSFVFGLLFLLFTTITQVYIETYGWDPQFCGLAYLGVGMGFFMAIIFVAKTSDATIIRLTKRNNGVYEPEMRLPTCVFFGFLIPISFFWYAKPLL